MHSITARSITMRRTFMGFARISLLLLISAFAGVSQAPAQIVGVSITVAPPPLPVYDQPPIPGPGYIWTPGYWAWDDGDYYWVPGTWCEPPTVGLLWTPGYWGWNDGIYVWNAGYWGPHVGFYGGVVYGFGYVGVGYAGGFWRGGVFSYNRTVNNFGSVNITNVYSKTVVVNNTTNVSFNGGAGGVTAKANQQELAAASERHVAATSVQTQHQQFASTNKDLRASVNGGHPSVAATSHAGRFEGAGVVAAHHDGAAGGAGHTGGAAGVMSHTGGEHLSPGGAHTATGGPKGTGALNTGRVPGGTGALNTGRGPGGTGALNTGRGPGGMNTQRPANTSLNMGPGAHTGGNTGLQPGRVTGGPVHTGGNPNLGGGIHTGGPPGGFRGGAPGGGGPGMANVTRFNAPRGPAPRGPAPRGPAPKGPPPHH